MGPLVSSAHQKQGAGLHRQRGRQEGATLVVDGRGVKVAGHEEGYYVGGTLFDNVTPEMAIYQEEIFGPVLSIMRASDFDSALQLVNSHEFGNGSAIFTGNGHSAREFVRRGAGGHGGRQRAGPGADGVPQLRRLEALGVWRAQRPRPRRRAFLHPHENRITARWPAGQQTVSEFSMPTLG